MLPITLVLVSALAAGEGRGAQTTWQIGIGVQGGYNSQPLGFAPNPEGFLILNATPWGTLRVESGRISETLRYSLFLDGLLQVQGWQFYPSYTNTLSSQTRIDLTARLTWNLGVTGSQGRLTSFGVAQDPTLRDVLALNTTQTNFFAAAANSDLAWMPTARLHVTQPLSFRAFIPYGDITSMGSQAQAGQVTGAPDSYSADAGIGVDYDWARLTAGASFHVGWFQAQTSSAGGTQIPALILSTTEVHLRVALAPRWNGTAYAGVFVATDSAHFLQGTQNDANGQPISYTLPRPVGGASLSYQFPRLEWLAQVAYDYSGAGEVYIGRLTLSHALTARLNVPIALKRYKGLVLSASAGYRYAELPVLGLPTTMAVDNPANTTISYNLAQFDAAVAWQINDTFYVSARYQFLYQVFSQNILPDLNGHLALLGVGFVYPAR